MEEQSGVRRPIYAIFQGGGAKGIAHAGAVAGIEANNLDVVGVAGTSAGALIATLVAIGYLADDIYEPASGRNILDTVNLNPVTALGEQDWNTLVSIKNDLRRIGVFVGLLGALLGSLGAPRTLPRLAWLLFRRGQLGPERVRDLVDQIVRKRLNDVLAAGDKPPLPRGPVKFKHLDPRLPTVVPLKIVATDIDNSALVVFSQSVTPEVCIGEAVAASVAIPLVFKPARIPSFSDSEFADGGLVANLPISVFTEERLCYERAHPHDPPPTVVGFTLVDPDTAADVSAWPQRKRDVVSYLARVAETALAGSQSVATSLIEDVVIVRLKTGMRLLGFDAQAEEFKAAHASGKACADEQLRAALQTKPDRVRDELARLNAFVSTLR